MDFYGEIEIFIKLVFLCQKFLTKSENDKKSQLPIFNVKIQKNKKIKRKNFQKSFLFYT